MSARSDDSKISNGKFVIDTQIINQQKWITGTIMGTIRSPCDAFSCPLPDGYLILSTNNNNFIDIESYNAIGTELSVIYPTKHVLNIQCPYNVADQVKKIYISNLSDCDIQTPETGPSIYIYLFNSTMNGVPIPVVIREKLGPYVISPGGLFIITIVLGKIVDITRGN